MKLGALKIPLEGGGFEVAPILQETFLFGRESGDCILQDEQASARHCLIQKMGKIYHLIDLNSSNGTFLNGSRIVKSKLQSGDRIRIGTTHMQFVTVDLQASPDPLRVLQGLLSGRNQRGQVPLDIQKQLARIRKELPRQASLVLDVVYGDGAKETLEFATGSPVLGRAMTIGRFSEDQELSKEHVQISVGRGGKLEVRDCGSTNGTFVNEKQIGQRATVIFAGDMIRIGRTRIWCRPRLP